MNDERHYPETDRLHSAKPQFPEPGVRPINRSRCLALLQRESHRPLLLLAAPTGYGKTVLLVEWAHELADGASVGWLTLDKRDNDPHRLTARLIMALPGIGDDVKSDMLEQLPDARLDNILRTLNGPEEVYLFLDQYEAIQEEAAHRVIEHLIVQSGKHVHVCIASREKPPFLPNLRRLYPGPAVISHEHLKLNAAEIRSWIYRKTRQQPTAESVLQWEHGTEGWPLALHLSEPLWDGSRARAPGDKAATDAMPPELRDILTDELLRHPEELQRFMMQTSIPDSFDTELGCWLTDHASFHDRIGQLLQQNLFLYPKKEGQYRYHGLFARMLRERFRIHHPDEFRLTQERTIAWYEQKGRIIEAVRHALNVPDYDRAAALLLGNIAATFACPKTELIHLLDRFPDSEIIRRPAIAMVYAWFLTAEHRVAKAETVLDQAEMHMKGEPCLFPPTGEDLRGYFASIRSRIHYLRRDAEKGMAYLQESEARLNGPGYLNSYLNTIDPAGSSLLKSDTGHWGAIDQSIAMCEYAESRWKGVNQGYGMIQVLLGECWHERNRPDKAEACLLNGRRIGLDLGDTGLILPATVALAQLKSDHGEIETAQILLQETAQLAVVESGENERAVIEACRARLDMKAGQSAAVRRWLRGLPAGTEGVLEMRRMYEYLTMLRAFLFLQQTRKGVRFGEKLLLFSESWYLHCHIAEISLLLAILYDRRGERSAAFRKLEKALDIGQKEGYIRLFLSEWADTEPVLRKYERQLRLKNNPASRNILRFCEELRKLNSENEFDADHYQYARKVLTKKEFDVLQCLIAGKSNAAIADELSIKIETAKTHCKNIYKKLRLKNRKDVQRRFADRQGT